MSEVVETVETTPAALRAAADKMEELAAHLHSELWHLDKYNFTFARCRDEFCVSSQTHIAKLRGIAERLEQLATVRP